MPLFPPLARATGVLEIIDGPLPVAFDEMACCMMDISRVNGLFGGRMVTMIHVKRLLGALPADHLITVLDVGTGAGDIPRALVRWARREGRPIIGIMCEYTPRELIMAAGAVPVCLCGGSAKTIPAAEEELPANLCPLIKSTFGYHVQKSNPFLEMADLVVAETTCDGKKKMYELMGEIKPLHLMQLPQVQDDAALDYWVLELKRLMRRLEDAFGVKITEESRSVLVTLYNDGVLPGQKTNRPAPPATERIQYLFRLKELLEANFDEIEQTDARVDEAERRLKTEGLVKTGERIVILSGTRIGQPGGTNLIKLHEVG